MLTTCKICKKSFKNKRAYNSHLKVHSPNYKKPTPPKIFKINCSFCNQLFTTNNIKKHENKCIQNPKNIKKCKYCKKDISVNNKFCSRRCAAKVNNYKRRGKDWQEEELKKNKRKHKGYHCKLYLIECKICNKKSLVPYNKKNNKTCSTKCKIVACTQRTYRNGSRKTIKYFNKNQNKEVVLESSWELEIAKLLDKYNIIWIRPKPIPWVNSEKKRKMYYPDFYLPSFNIYLDPKNPYCMIQDKEKMDIIKNKINIIFGDIKIIKNYIYNLYNNL